MKTGVCEWVRTQHCYWSFVIERRTIFHLCKTFQIVCNCNQGVTGSFRQQLLMMTSSAKRRTRAWSREETIIMARGASLSFPISRYDKKYRNCNHRERSGNKYLRTVRRLLSVCLCEYAAIQSYLRLWGQVRKPFLKMVTTDLKQSPPPPSSNIVAAFYSKCPARGQPLMLWSRVKLWWQRSTLFIARIQSLAASKNSLHSHPQPALITMNWLTIELTLYHFLSVLSSKSYLLFMFLIK